MCVWERRILLFAAGFVSGNCGRELQTCEECAGLHWWRTGQAHVSVERAIGQAHVSVERAIGTLHCGYNFQVSCTVDTILNLMYTFVCVCVCMCVCAYT